MKRTIKLLSVTALCIFYFTQNSFAQKKNHIYFGYGVPSANSIADELVDILVTTATGGAYQTSDSKYTGAIFAGYRGYITDKLELGGTFIFEHASKDLLVESAKSGSMSSNSFTILAELKYNYINRRRFRLHSGIGGGLANTRVSINDNDKAKTEKDKMNDFAYQIDAIGVSYGDKISFSLNAGYGYKGIVNVVLAYGF